MIRKWKCRGLITSLQIILYKRNYAGYAQVPILAFGTAAALRSRFMRPLGAVSIAATLRGWNWVASTLPTGSSRFSPPCAHYFISFSRSYQLIIKFVPLLLLLLMWLIIIRIGCIPKNIPFVIFPMYYIYTVTVVLYRLPLFRFYSF